MDIAVKGANRKELQERADEPFGADFSPASGFFFTSPFRSLITAGCFSRVTQPAADAPICTANSSGRCARRLPRRAPPG